MPEANAVARQPFVVNDQAMIGAIRPATLRAELGHRHGHRAAALEPVHHHRRDRHEAGEVASKDVIMKIMKKVVSESTRLKAMNPRPKITAPTRMTVRGL